MPSSLTIFAGSTLVYLDALLATAVLAYLLYRRPRTKIIQWVIAVVIVLAVSGVLAQIGAAVYKDPRPFTSDHVKPLIAHAPGNGFPSDHALLAAAIVAAVVLAASWPAIPWPAIPFIILAVLVDWARVGAGIHHVDDVIGSSIFVAIATLIAASVAPLITRRLVPLLPSWLHDSTEPAAASTPIQRA